MNSLSGLIEDIPQAEIPAQPGSLAFGYVRVSTDEQAESGVSAQLQRQGVIDYCKRTGLCLLRIYTDLGVSGGKPLASRPAGALLEKQLAHRDARGVNLVIKKLDRGFRNALDARSYAEKLRARGQGLHIIDMGGEALDTTTAMGRAFFGVMAEFAELERNKIRDRVKQAMAYKRKARQRYSGRVPYGWDFDPSTNALVPNQKQQEGIGLMLFLSAKGRSTRFIARDLARNGFRAPLTNWHHQTIYRILKRVRESQSELSLAANAHLDRMRRDQNGRGIRDTKMLLAKELQPPTEGAI